MPQRPETTTLTWWLMIWLRLLDYVRIMTTNKVIFLICYILCLELQISFAEANQQKGDEFADFYALA